MRCELLLNSIHPLGKELVRKSPEFYSYLDFYKRVHSNTRIQLFEVQNISGCYYSLIAKEEISIAYFLKKFATPRQEKAYYAYHELPHGAVSNMCTYISSNINDLDIEAYKSANIIYPYLMEHIAINDFFYKTSLILEKFDYRINIFSKEDFNKQRQHCD